MKKKIIICIPILVLVIVAVVLFLNRNNFYYKSIDNAIKNSESVHLDYIKDYKSFSKMVKVIDISNNRKLCVYKNKNGNYFLAQIQVNKKGHYNAKISDTISGEYKKDEKVSLLPMSDEIYSSFLVTESAEKVINSEPLIAGCNYETIDDGLYVYWYEEEVKPGRLFYKFVPESELPQGTETLLSQN